MELVSRVCVAGKVIVTLVVEYTVIVGRPVYVMVIGDLGRLWQWQLALYFEISSYTAWWPYRWAQHQLG